MLMGHEDTVYLLWKLVKEKIFDLGALPVLTERIPRNRAFVHAEELHENPFRKISSGVSGQLIN